MENDNSEPDLTPMLDVVFIMLIFFIVTATFVKEVGLELPSSNDKSPADAAEQSAVIEIGASNRYLLNGRAIDKRALQNRLSAYRAEHPQSPLVIKSDPQADVDALVWAMDAGRAAGMEIAFAASG